MADFVTLSCPTCGGRLNITRDIDRFACAHCGNEHLVRRSGGTITLSPVIAGLARVQAGVDKTASELAVKRLRGEVLSLRSAIDTKRRARTNAFLLGAVGSFFGILLLLQSAFSSEPETFLCGAGALAIAGYIFLGAFSRLRDDPRTLMLLQQKATELRRHEQALQQ